MKNKMAKKAAELFVVEYLRRDIEVMDIVDMLGETPGGEDMDAVSVYNYARSLLSDAVMILSERYSEK